MRHTVVTLDLGGRGASGVTCALWSIPAFADDVGAVLEQMELSPLVLVAHSMGGPGGCVCGPKKTDSEVELQLFFA